MSASHILVVDDESDIRRLLKEILTEEDYEVSDAADAAEARQCYSDQSPDLVLLDIWMPDTDGITLLREWADDGLVCPIVMMSGHGTVDTAVEATRLGAFDFIEKPLSLAKLLRTVERALNEGGNQPKSSTRRLVPAVITPIGKSAAMHELREQIRKIAPYNTAVLLTGEPGTGREAFARYLHSLSPRASAPFVELVSGSLSEENAAGQLLGHDGAEPGYLEQAGGGVLYLNELGDLPASAQRTLLGVLERGEFLRIGGRKPARLDARLVSCATPGFDTRLGDAFRHDLLAHLSVISIRVPPLREYSEDVPDLLNYYVDVLVDQERLPFRRFSVAAKNRLRNYPWPGNVRKLKNIVNRLLILGGDEEISLEEVEETLAAEAPANEPLVKQDLLSLPLREAREHFERAYLQQQLMLCGGKVGRLAERVGMERTHLYRKLRSLGVDFGQGSGDD